jgi:hypothetical protein
MEHIMRQTKRFQLSIVEVISECKYEKSHRLLPLPRSGRGVIKWRAVSLSVNLSVCLSGFQDTIQHPNIDRYF